jgi:hypothetical protein
VCEIFYWPLESDIDGISLGISRNGAAMAAVFSIFAYFSPPKIRKPAAVRKVPASRPLKT